jgi:hypothetical protein
MNITKIEDGYLITKGAVTIHLTDSESYEFSERFEIDCEVEAAELEREHD